MHGNVCGIHAAFGTDLERVHYEVEEVRPMSRRKNGTNRAASVLGINPYGRGNGKARKRPREVRTPIGQMKNNTMDIVSQKTGGNQGDEI